MKKMKAHVLEEIGKIQYREVERPILKDGEALVHVRAAGICGSDIPRIYETGTYHFPTIPGHEFAGEVVEVFDSKYDEWIGKRVGVFPLIPCKECSACSKQQYEMCRNYNYLGSRCDGGFAEFTAVPIWNLLELPANVAYESAAMFEPAAVALHAVRRLDLYNVKSVALLGLGTIGNIIAQWLNIFGIKTVYATCHREEHGELMKKNASSDYQYINSKASDVCEWIIKETENQGVDVVIDCVGSSSSFSEAIKVVSDGGQILLVGNPKSDLVLMKDVYWKILRKQISVIGTWNSQFIHSEEDDWHLVMKKCQEGTLRLGELITHKYSFCDLKQGLELIKNGTDYHNKVMIVR